MFLVEKIAEISNIPDFFNCTTVIQRFVIAFPLFVNKLLCIYNHPL